MIRQLNHNQAITSGLNFAELPVMFIDTPNDPEAESLVLVFEDIQSARRVHAAAAEAVAHFEGAGNG